VDLETTISLALADDIKEFFENLDESSSAACSSLTSLRRDLKLIVRSSLGFTLRLGGTPPATLTSVDHFVQTTDIAASLRFPLSWLGPEEDRSSIVFYAGAPGAFDDLAADLASGLDLSTGCIRLDEDLTPELLVSGVVGVEEMSTVNQAIGVLIGRGHTCETAQAELHRQSSETQQSAHHNATRLLLSLSSG
jgi:hypothetical protein